MTLPEKIALILNKHNKVDMFDDGDFAEDSIDDNQATTQILLAIKEEVEKLKREVTPVNYDYKGLFCPYCNTAIPNEEVYIHNTCLSDITKLLGGEK